MVLLQTVLMSGIFAEWLRDRKTIKNKVLPAKISVIIPVHNESHRIKGLLDTLLKAALNKAALNKAALNDNEECGVEIIFIDDRSTDNSAEKLLQFAKEAQGSGVKCRVISLDENTGINCKQFALSKGIREARGDYFLFTDGDCEVPAGWINEMVRRIQDGKTGAVIGPVFKKSQKNGFLYLYQCFDHAVRYNYLAGAIGLGAAGGGFGNNLIISRKALDEAGGYDAIPPSPTEDAALISKIRRMGKYRIRAVFDTAAAVETETEKTWRSFINQTLRWNNGGLFSPEFVTRFNYNLLMIVIGTGILAVPLLPFFPGLWPMPAGVLAGMIQNTIAAFILYRYKLPKGGILIKLSYFILTLFMPVYLTLMTLMSYAGIKPKWKT